VTLGTASLGTATRMRRRSRSAVLASVVALAVSAGCSGSGTDSADGSGLTVRLVVPDGNVRPPDVPCTGAGGFRYAHPEASYAIADLSGSVVATGSLPSGRSEPMSNLDLGDERQPTVCVMMLDVSGLESVRGFTLAIDGRPSKPIRPNRNLDGIPEVVLR
jgi:hypothetical protein